MNYDTLSNIILEHVGGKNNIANVCHCVTRLRFDLNDFSLADHQKLKALPDVLGVVEGNGQLQVIIGNEVDKVYQVLIGLISSKESLLDKKQHLTTSIPLKDRILDFISGCFMPLLAPLVGSGLLKGVCIILLELGLVDSLGATYKILMAAGNAVFYFLPVMLGFTASQKLGANPFIGAVIGAALLEPNSQSLIGQNVTFMAIPISIIDYGSSTIPVIIASVAYAFLERFLNCFVHKSIKIFAVPFLSLLIIVPLTFLVFAPLGVYIGQAISYGFNWMYHGFPALTGLVFGATFFMLIIFGLHWGLVSVMYIQLGVDGFVTIVPILLSSSYAQMGVALAFLLKTMDKNLKAMAGSSLITAFLTGVTEPILYGIVLRGKNNFLPLIIGGGVGGMLVSLLKTRFSYITMGGLVSLPAIMGGLSEVMKYVITALIAFSLAFFTTIWCNRIKITDR